MSESDSLDLRRRFERAFDKREDGRERIDQAIVIRSGASTPEVDWSLMEEGFQLIAEAAGELSASLEEASADRTGRLQFRTGTWTLDAVRGLVADCFKDAAIAAGHLEDHESAIRFLRRAMEIAKAIRKESVEVARLKGKLSNNLGFALMHRADPGDLEEARSLLESALRWYGRAGDRKKQANTTLILKDLAALEAGESVELWRWGYRTEPNIPAHRPLVRGAEALPEDAPAGWITSDDPGHIWIDGVRHEISNPDAVAQGLFGQSSPGSGPVEELDDSRFADDDN